MAEGAAKSLNEHKNAAKSPPCCTPAQLDELQKRKRRLQYLEDDETTDSPESLEDSASIPVQEGSSGGRTVSGSVIIHEDALSQIIDYLFSSADNASRQFRAVQLSRRVLCGKTDPSKIDVITHSGILTQCVEFLKDNTRPDLQFEVIWLLINITAGDTVHTNAVVSSGAIDVLIHLLRCKNPRIVEHAVWALGNIARDYTVYRDIIVYVGGVPPLLTLAKHSKAPEMVQQVSWIMSSLRHSTLPEAPREALSLCLPNIIKLLAQTTDINATCMASIALSHFCVGNSDNVTIIEEAGIIPNLVDLLKCEVYSVVSPCIRIIGYILTGNDFETTRPVKYGVIPILLKLLHSKRPLIAKEAALAVSNIAVGPTFLITEIIRYGIVPVLVKLVNNDNSYAQHEALFALTNIAVAGNLQHIFFLGHNQVIEAMCRMLTSSIWQILSAALDGLAHILDKNKRGTFKIEACGGYDLIEVLQSHDHRMVYIKACTIIGTYFPEDRDGLERFVHCD